MSEPKTILLVDDDREFVQSNRDLLESEGYNIIEANDGAAGFELAKQEKPDLMILDVMMATDTEGFEISRKVAQTPELEGMKVILVTGIRKDMHLPFGFTPDDSWLPVEEVLEKPVMPKQFLEEIKKRLG